MAYNGRISSVLVSGTDVIRPKGFYPSESDDNRVKLQPSQKLDFEMELGCFISHPVAPGDVVSAKDAWKHVFGYVLLNDWSARDTQRYEMHPFGPFHSKSFLTSVSPWVVTPEALQGSLVGPAPANQMPIDAHLQSDLKNHAAYDIEFSVFLSRKSNHEIDHMKNSLTIYRQFLCSSQNFKIISQGLPLGLPSDDCLPIFKWLRLAYGRPSRLRYKLFTSQYRRLNDTSSWFSTLCSPRY
jgi:fumarylacetoacetase